MISCRDRWPWAKPGDITMTRTQSNNQWNGGIAAHPDPPQKIRSAKIRWKSSRLEFFGIKTASSSLTIFQRTKLLTRSITHLCWCKWRTFERKTQRGNSPRVSFIAWQCPGSPGTCNPEETGLPGLPMSWSPTLFSVSGPVGLPPVPWTGKNNLKLAIFRTTQRSLLPRRPGWKDKFFFFFWVACRSWSNGLRSVLSFVGSMLNKSRFCRCSLFHSWSG